MSEGLVEMKCVTLKALYAGLYASTGMKLYLSYIQIVLKVSY